MLFKNNIESRRKKTALLLGKIGAVLSVPVIVYSFGTNPPLPNTGAPGEGTCASCHGTLTAGSGITITLPATTYTPGGPAVAMTVAIPAVPCGGTGGGCGFELTALTQSGNASAGTLAATTPPNAAFPQDAVSTVGSRQYAFSTVETTSWVVSWTPPATNVGNVVFYATGGQHNTNFSNSVVLTPAVVPPPPPPTPTLLVNPTSLTFTVNGAAPADQTISVTSSGTQVAVTASSSTTPSGGTWLTIMPPGGNTPLTETVHIVATGLAAGTYNGSVSFASTGASNSPQSVPVTLIVTTPIPPPTTPPTLNLTSTGLTFNATVGGAAPSPQSVTVSTSNGSAVTFTDSATTATGGSWLSVDTAAHTTPTSEPISIATVPSTAGTYQGTVTFTSSATSPTSITLPVTLIVASSTPPPTTNTPWSFSHNVVDRQMNGTDYMLLDGSGGVSSTGQLRGSGSFTRFQSLTQAPATTPIVENGSWRVTGLAPMPNNPNLITTTVTTSTGTTITRVTGGTVVVQVAITIAGCNSGSGGGEIEDGTPGPTPTPITGTLTIVSNGSTGSGVSLNYNGTCSTTSPGTPTPSGSFISAGIGTYSIGNGGGN